MKKILFYLLICFLFIPSIVFAEGLEVEYVSPKYDVNQVTYLNSNVEKPNVFNFTFTPNSRDMSYNIKVSNHDDKPYYITNIDHSMHPNIRISYSGISETNVISPGEFKILNVKFELLNFPTEENYSNTFQFFLEYDLAENYIDSSSSEVIKGNNSVDENPPTGLVNYIKIGIPIIVVLGISLYFINKKKKIFKAFVFLLIPIIGSLIIKNVYADKSERRLVITGNIDFRVLPKVCTDNCKGTPEDYNVYMVEINPNEGLYNKCPDVFRANYLKDLTVDLDDIDREYYKFTGWTYNGSPKTFPDNKLTVTEESLLKANWEYGPYFWIRINPNGGTYKGTANIYKFKLKAGESYELENPTRPGYEFYKWNEVSNTHQLSNGKNITIGISDVEVSARWEGIYELTFDPGADDATVTPAKKEVANLFPFGELPTPRRAGYTFDGWYLDGQLIDAEMIFDKDKDVTAVAHWIANKDTRYRVRHWVTKIGKDSSKTDSDNYELLDEETFRGETDTKVTPEVRKMEGFTSPPAIEVNINGDESRVVNYYYTRNKYDLTLVIPSVGIKEIRYMINGSSSWDSTDTTLVLKVDYNSVYKAYGVAANGYSYNLTTASNPFTGTMKTTPIIFNPTSTICPAGQYAGEGATTCTPCAKGTYSTSDGSATCLPCASGYYQTSTGSISCNICPAGHQCGNPIIPPTQCPAGTYAAEGSATCTPCADGYYNSKTGQSSCNKCPAGSSCSNKEKDPVPCAAGTIAATDGQTSCTPCPAGKYQNLTGQTSCGTCQAGQYSGVGATTCTSCPVGQYSDRDGSGSCTKCPAGKYQGSTGQTSCGTCTAGTYSTEGSASCTNCPAGQYSNQNGAGSCTKCPAGQYQSLTGQTSCGTCAAGTYSTLGSSTCTRCPKGQYSNISGASSCTKCSQNTYADTLGSTSCKNCATGYESGTGAEVCSIKTFDVTFKENNSNTFTYSSTSPTTVRIEYGGTINKTISITNGYYISAITCTNDYGSEVNYSFLETTGTPSSSTQSYNATVVIRNNNKLVGSTCSYTVTQIKASMIEYTKANGTKTTVRDALDELYGLLTR